MKNKKLIIFGAGDIAQLANYYFSTDSEYEVVVHTVDSKYKNNENFMNLPLISFEEIEKGYPPADYEIFIALSYSGMNTLRRTKLNQAKEKGYRIASYISSFCTYMSEKKPGENAFILEDNTIQPFTEIGENVMIWSGNHIGHHSNIMNDNFISSHVVISGHCIINENCFLGVNSTLAHNVILAKGT